MPTRTLLCSVPENVGLDLGGEADFTMYVYGNVCK